MSSVSFLISDPSSALQTFFRNVLTGHGFDAAAIKTATTPHGAAEIAPSLKPDLLLTDWFPKETLSGPDLFREVQKCSPGCKIALMAQGVDASHELQAKTLGALFLLNKPFTAETARNAMAKALDVLGKARAPSPVQIVLPKLPQYKPGDAVVYRNRTERVQHVILRRGEMVVQLQGIPGMIEADRVQPL